MRNKIAITNLLSGEQRWTQIRIRSGADSESGYTFRNRILIFGKNQIRTRIRYVWYDVYKMYVKAWQRWARSRIRIGVTLEANRKLEPDPKSWSSEPDPVSEWESIFLTPAISADEPSRTSCMGPLVKLNAVQLKST